MPTYLVTFVLAAFIWRIFTVLLSTRNEIALRKAGAREVGAANSMLLAGAHVAFYGVAVFESATLKIDRSAIAAALGVAIYALSMLALIAVIRSLRRLWTIKIMIAADHHVVRTGLFSRFRHPNYFLNIIPELVGFGLALNAFWTMILGIPLYLIPLAVRIRQEEVEMTSSVAGYHTQL